MYSRQTAVDHLVSVFKKICIVFIILNQTLFNALLEKRICALSLSLSFSLQSIPLKLHFQKLCFDCTHTHTLYEPSVSRTSRVRCSV